MSRRKNYKTKVQKTARPTEKARSTRSRQKTYKTRINKTVLPTELWLVIFDIVIEEAIIWLEKCDYMTFPLVGPIFSASARCYQFYDSHYRLRLVCQAFNTILGARPWQSFSDSSSLPFSFTTRSLHIDLKRLGAPHFHRLFAEASTFGRILSLDVDCGISSYHFLETSARRAFPNVQRLVLRIGNVPLAPQDCALWTLLHRAFPLLVTLVILAEDWFDQGEFRWNNGDGFVCFERLEMLYFGSNVPYLGCHFPRLRRASIWGCSPPELETLLWSPHLESLHIRTNFVGHNIDVRSCLRLKVLGLEYEMLSRVILSVDHPVEYLWLHCTFSLPDPETFQMLWRSQPKVYQVIMEFSSSNRRYRWKESYDQLEMKLDSFESSMLPSMHGDRCLVFGSERGGCQSNRVIS